MCKNGSTKVGCVGKKPIEQKVLNRPVTKVLTTPGARSRKSKGIYPRSVGCFDNTEKRMRDSGGSASRTEDLLLRLTERRRLVAVVTDLVREVERLHEDNAQLRAAIALYREVAGRRSTRQSG